MKIVASKTREQIAEERKRRYLEAWPVHRQMEALTEAAAGRPEKLERMQAEMAVIKESLPYP